MKTEGFFKTYQSLLYAVLCFFIGISTLIDQECKHFTGWFILAISFGFLETFFEKKIRNTKQRKVLIILTYAIAVGLFLWALTRLF